MPYISYDTERQGVVVGRFNKENLAQKNKYPYISVSQTEFEAISRDPNNYQVVEGKLVAIERTFTNFIKVKTIQAGKRSTAKSILEPLLVGDYSYLPDSAFQKNLTLNLAISAHDVAHVTLLWCSKNDKWEFKQHDKTELLAIACALNTRRETKSEELYKNL